MAKRKHFSKEIKPLDRGLTRKQADQVVPFSEQTLSNMAVQGIGPPFHKHKARAIYMESDLINWMRSLPSGGSAPVEVEGDRA
jgi:hypothetical protein